MRKKWQLIISGAVVLVLMSTMYITFSAKNNKERSSILVAVRDIRHGETISRDMFREVEMQNDLFMNGVTWSDELSSNSAGRDIFCGDVLSQNDLSLSDRATEYPVMDPDNKLYSICLRPEQANACWLYENSYIDIFVEIPTFSNSTELMNGTIENILSSVHVIENVRIIRILDENGKEITEDSGDSRILCLELSAEEIKILAANNLIGDISVAAKSKEGD